MNEEIKNDLFAIRLTEDGIYHIRRTMNRIKVGYILFILSTFLAIIYQAYNLAKDNYEYGTGLVALYMKASPWLIIGATLLTVWANYYFFIFFRRLNRSIEDKNEIMFNHAFRYAFTNSGLVIAVVVCYLFFDVMTLVILLDRS